VWGTKCEVVVRMSMSSYSMREQKECGGGVECDCRGQGPMPRAIVVKVWLGRVVRQA
jgi:hypothetical protein